MPIQSLRESLQQMTEIDGAQHQLAISLGIVSPDADFSTEVKHLYWTDNPIGNLLYRMIQDLISQEILVTNSDQDCVMWNPHF